MKQSLAVIIRPATRLEWVHCIFAPALGLLSILKLHQGPIFILLPKEPPQMNYSAVAITEVFEILSILFQLWNIWPQQVLWDFPWRAKALHLSSPHTSIYQVMVDPTVPLIAWSLDMFPSALKDNYDGCMNW